MILEWIFWIVKILFIYTVVVVFVFEVWEDGFKSFIGFILCLCLVFLIPLGNNYYIGKPTSMYITFILWFSVLLNAFLGGSLTSNMGQRKKSILKKLSLFIIMGAIISNVIFIVLAIL